MLKSNSKFIQYGKKYNGSIYLDFMREYIDLFGNDYQGDYKITNSISNEYIDIRQNLDNEWFCDRLSNYLVDGRKMLQEDLANTQMFGSHLDTNQKVIFDAKNTKAYYVLSKNLNGFDNNRDNYNDYCEEPNSENTQIVAKDLVVGNGSYEKPYYSDTQNLAFNTNEEEFWCKFYINGATDIKYSISSNYKCTLFTKYDGITLNQRRIWFNEGNDIVYKNTEIYNGENEYLVKIERIPNSIEMGNIYIEFVQYQDVIQNVKGAKWIAEDDSVKSTEFEFYDTLYFVNKEIAPLVVKDEYTNNESLIHKREQLINNILTINDYIGAIITINSIRIGAMPQTGEEVLEFLAKNESQSWLKDIIKNRYCTDGYRQSLLDESGYYIPTTITEDANKVIGLCKYGLIIKEQKSNLFESIVTMLKLKECERWDEINAYGLIGTVGRWIDE